MDKSNRMLKHRRSSSLAKRACTLYTVPTASTTIPAFTTTTLKWDPSCYAESAGSSLDNTPVSAPSNIDLYLYDDTKPIMQWKNVPFAKGELDTQFEAKWWGNTSQERVHLQMLNSGDPLWSTVVPSGPIFLVSFNGTYPTSSSSSPSTPNTSNGDGLTFSSITLGSSSHSLSGGKLAAAIIVPILFLGSLAIGYVAYSRFKTRKQTKRYSAYVDDRMSAMNAPSWQPGSVRHSMASHRSQGSQQINSRLNPAFEKRHSNYLASLPQAHVAGGGSGGSMEMQQTSPRLSQNPNRASRISFAPSAHSHSSSFAANQTNRQSKRYSLASGAGAMGAGSRLNPGHGHQRGAGSSVSALSAYSTHSGGLQPSPLAQNFSGGISPSASAKTFNTIGHGSNLRREISHEEEDELAMSPDQTVSPMMLAAGDVDQFRSGPAPPTPRKEKNLTGQRESVVSVSAALQNELNEMGPAIRAIVSGQANGEEREVVGRTGWDDDEEEDGAHRRAPKPPMEEVRLGPMERVEVNSSPNGKGKKGFLGGLFGGKGQTEEKTKGKLVIGSPIIIEGSELDEVRKTGRLRTQNGDVGMEGYGYGANEGGMGGFPLPPGQGTWKGGFAE